MPDAQHDIFLSHNSQDDAAAVRIATKLLEAGFQPWIDNWNCAPGRRFPREIDDGIRQSRAFAVLIGPGGISNWVDEEIDIAFSRSVKDPAFRIFLVLLPGLPNPFDRTTLPSFLNTRGWVDFRGGFESDRQFQAIIDAIQGRAPGPPQPVPVDDTEPPYRGLEVFDEEHAAYYFGRATDVQNLLEKLKSTRFLAVLGPSGTGKSSLVRAGLIPALRAGRIPGSERWRIVVTRPGAHPLASLAAELVRLDPSAPLGPTLDRLAADRRTLDHAANLLFDASNPQGRLVIVVDQFEEVFTLCHDEAERQQYLDNLLTAATGPDGRCMVVLTLRADFYPRCAAYPELAALVGGQQELIGPLDREGMRAVIVEPAYRAGLQFEDGLVEVILEDVEQQPGALPLLEHALLELWRHRRGPLLTLEGYRASGGVSGAIAKTAEKEYGALSAEEQRVARQMFLRLTEPGEGTEDTRRRARIDELASSQDEIDRVESVIDRLVAARLITTSAADDLYGRPQVEVAHEALIRGWPTLKAWIDEDRDGLRLHRRITNDALEWQRVGYDEDAVYRGARLLEAEEFDQRPKTHLNELETAFIGWGVALRDRERIEAELRRRQREETQRRWIAGLATAAILSLLVGVYAWDQRGNAIDKANAAAVAREEKAIEASKAQTAEAERAAEASIARTAEAAAVAQATIAAIEAENARTAEDDARTQQAIAEANATEAGIARDEADAARTVAEEQEAAAAESANESKARELAAIATSDTVRIDTALLAAIEADDIEPDAVSDHLISQILLTEPRLLKVIPPPNPAPELDYAFCLLKRDDHFLIASLISAETIHLVDPRTSLTVSVLGDPTASSGRQGFIACHPNGNLIATASSTRAGVTIWNASTGRIELRLPVAFPGDISQLVFMPSGTDLAIATSTRLYFWNLATLRETIPFSFMPTSDTLRLNLVQLASQGSSLHYSLEEGRVHVVDARTGTTYPIPAWDPEIEFLGSPNQVALSPDGSFAAFVVHETEPERTGASWHLAILPISPNATPQTVYWHPFSVDDRGDVVNDISISPDNTWIALASTSGSILLFEMIEPGVYQQMEPIQPIIQGYGMITVEFFPDRPSHLASRTGDGVLALWDLEGFGPLAHQLSGDQTRYANVDIDPNGSVIAYLDCTGAVTIWQVGAPEPLLQESSGLPSCLSMAGIQTVAVHPEGKYVAWWRTDGSIWLFDIVNRVYMPGSHVDSGMFGTLQFSGDGRWLHGAEAGGIIHRWRVEPTGLVRVESFDLGSHDKPLVTFAWSPNGRYLVVERGMETYLGFTSRVALEVWDVEHLPTSWTLPTDYAELQSILTIGVDDKPMVLGARFDGMIIEWMQDEAGVWRQSYGGFNPAFLSQWHDLAVGDEAVFVGLGGLGNRVSLYSSSDMPILSWRVPVGSKLGSTFGTSIDMSIDGRIIVTSHTQGVWLWSLDVSSMREIACEAAGRNFSMDEWRQFFGDAPYRRTCEQFPPGWGAPPIIREELLLWQ